MLGDIVEEDESVVECRSCDPDLELNLSNVIPGTAGSYEYTQVRQEQPVR